MRGSTSASWLVTCVLGPSGQPRTRVAQALLALLVYALFALVQLVEVALGLLDPHQSNRLIAFSLAGALGFYLAIRSGLSQHVGKDPSLTLAQGGFAMCAVTWSYAITGPAHGAVLSIFILVIVFGMLRLSTPQARGFAIAALMMLAAVMLWQSRTDPARYDPRLELVNFLLVAVVAGATAKLSIRLGRLRSRLSQRTRDLAQALELNRHLATCDSLTGLPNRRAMAALLAQEQLRESQNCGPMALAILDIDWFKQINDTFGHRVGDAVLQRFAELARMELRGGDALARWGGEEFLLMMPDTRRERAHVAVDRMRVRIAEGGFDGLAEGLKVSFSAGITECAAEESVGSAIERADRALYQAKNAGRNRIQCA